MAEQGFACRMSRIWFAHLPFTWSQVGQQPEALKNCWPSGVGRDGLAAAYALPCSMGVGWVRPY